MAERTTARRSTTPKSPRKNFPRINSTIFKKIIDKITDFGEKIIDKLTTERSLVNFLEAQGMNNPERYEILMKRMLSIRSESEVLLTDLVNDIMSTRSKRRYYYMDTIKKHNVVLSKTRIDSDNKASKEMKQRWKSIFRNYKMQYGFFKAFKHTRAHFAKEDLNKMHEELANYYLENSNYNLVEYMIKGLKMEYLIEEEIFLRCIRKLMSKYTKNHSDLFKELQIESKMQKIPI